MPALFRLLHLLTATAVCSCLIPVPASYAVAQTTPSNNRLAQSNSASNEAKRLLQQGFQQLYTSQLQDALSSFQQAIEQYRQAGDRSGEAAALLGQSEAYLWSGRYSDELAAAQQALEIYQALQDRSGEAAALQMIGDAQLNLEQTDEGVATLQQALTIRREVNDRQGEGWTLGLLGIGQVKQGQVAEGLEAMQQSIAILQEPVASQDQLQQQHRQAVILVWIGNAYRQQGEYEQANEFIQQALTLTRSMGNRAVEKIAQFILGALATDQNQPDAGIAAYQQVQTLAAQTGNQTSQGWALYRIGEIYKQQEQYSQALEAFQQALSLFQAIGNQQAQGDTTNQIGIAYYRQEQYEQAIPYFEQALAAYQAVESQQDVRQAYSNLGSAHEELEQFDQALQAYQQALEVARQTGEQSAQGEALRNIGSLYSDQDQYPQALENYQQALTLFRAVEDRPNELSTLNSIGYAYINSQQYEQARPFFQQQLEIARQTDNRAHEAFGIWGIGATYGRQAQQFHSDGAYAEAVAAAQQAIEPYQQALVLAEEAEFSPDLIKALISNFRIAYNTQGFGFSDQQQYPEAIAAFQQALNVLETYRDLLPEPDYLESRMSTSLQLGLVYSSNGQNAEALTAYQAVKQIAAQLNDPAQQLQAMGFVSYIHSNLGNYDEALTTAQQMVSIAREQLPDDADTEMEALIKLGLAYSNLGQYSTVLEQYQQALVIAKELNDIDTEISLLNNIATVYSAQGQYIQSLETQQRALTLQQRAIEQIQTGTTESFERFCAGYPMEDTSIRQGCLETYRHGLAVSLNNLVSAYANLGRYPEALAAHEQALAIVQEYKKLALESSLLLNVGNVHSTMGDHAKALEVFERSLEIGTTTGNRSTQIVALNNIGQVYSEQGRYPEALKFFQRSLELAQEIGAPDQEATVLNNIGSVYGTQGRNAEALAAYQQSLAIRQQIGSDPSTELNNIATLESGQGRNAEALEKLQQALTIAQASGARQSKAVVLGNISDIYAEQAEYAKSIELRQQSLAIHQEIGARSSEISGLIGLGRSYHELGQYNKALELHQQALNLSREIGERPSEIAALGNIGRVYLEQKQYSQALTLYQQGLQIAREIGNVATEAGFLDAIGRAYERQGQFDRAIETYQQALKIERETSSLLAEAATLRGLGASYAAKGQQTEAVEAFQQALTIQRQIGTPAEEARTLASLGKFFTDQEQPELAIVFYKQSVNVTESIRQKIGGLSQEQQESYTETVADTYRELADLLLQNDRVLEAQKVLDLLKVQELEDYLQNVRGNAETANGVVFLRQEQDILTKYNQLQQSAIELAQERLQLEDKVRQGQLTPSEQQRLQEIDRLQGEIRVAFNDFSHSEPVRKLLDQLSYEAQTQVIPLGALDRLKDKLQTLNAALIYPLILDDRIELIITLPNPPPLRRTVNVDRADLNNAIVEFRQALQNPNADAVAPAQQLYRWLIAPLEADLAHANIQTLIYSPDGQLRYIPLAALHDGKQWLAQRYRINNITAASLEELDTQPQAEPRVLAGAFADETISYPVKVGQDDVSFRGLPFAGQEVATLAETLPNTEFYVDLAFSAATLTSLMNAHNILHLATHAAFVPGSAEQSFILFGDGKPSTLRDIEAWTLSNIDLVVLSACETGLGGFDNNGEQILGLGYQFQSQGARAVIASLWQVNDGGTQVLMNAFYYALENGMTKAEAIRQAQIALITGNLTAVGDPRGSVVAVSTETGLPASVSQNLNHPYYWGPFILIGNGL